MAPHRARFVVALCFLSLTHFGFCQEEPCSNPSPLITGTRFRVVDQLFQASSFQKTYPPHGARIDGPSWCSEVKNQSSDNTAWIEVLFGTDVVVTEIQTAGRDSAYLERFQIYYGSVGDLEPLQNTTLGQTYEFTHANGESIETTVLPSPIVTQVLRIVPVTWTSTNGSVCLKLEAFGCLYEPKCTADISLSTDRKLLPLANIDASSAMQDFLPGNVVDSFFRTILGRLFYNSWCTDEPFQDGERPYIVLNFTQSVWLTHISIRGDSFRFSYVKNFSIDTFDRKTGEFVPYSLLGMRDFIVDRNSITNYTLWESANSVAFRFRIHDALRAPFNDEICWNIQLFGCVSTSIGPQSTTVATTSPNTVTEGTQTQNDMTEATQITNGTTEVTQNPNAMTEATQTPNGATEATQSPNAITEATQNPNAMTEATQSPNGMTEATQGPNVMTEATQNPNAMTEATQSPNGLTEATQSPNGTTEATRNSNAMTEATQNPNGAAEAPQTPNGATKATQISNAMTESTQTQNGATEATQTPNAMTESTQTPNGVTEVTQTPNGMTEVTQTPNVMAEADQSVPAAGLSPNGAPQSSFSSDSRVAIGASIGTLLILALLITTVVLVTVLILRRLQSKKRLEAQVFLSRDQQLHTQYNRENPTEAEEQQQIALTSEYLLSDLQ